MTPLTEDELGLISEGHCPKCIGRGFVIGPMGGASINIECAQVTCRERFNVLFWRSKATHGERIGNGWDDIPWPSEPQPGAPA